MVLIGSIKYPLKCDFNSIVGTGIICLPSLRRACCAFSISLGVATSSIRIYRSGSCKPKALVIFLTILSEVPIIISLLGLILSNCSRTDLTCTSS